MLLFILLLDSKAFGCNKCASDGGFEWNMLWKYPKGMSNYRALGTSMKMFRVSRNVWLKMVNRHVDVKLRPPNPNATPRFVPWSLNLTVNFTSTSVVCHASAYLSLAVGFRLKRIGSERKHFHLDYCTLFKVGAHEKVWWSKLSDWRAQRLRDIELLQTGITSNQFQ